MKDTTKSFLKAIPMSLFVAFIVWFLTSDFKVAIRVFLFLQIFLIYILNGTVILNSFDVKEMIFPIWGKIIGIFIFMFAVLFFMELGTVLIWDITKADYCEGWAKSVHPQKCAVQEVDEYYSLINVE